MDYKNSIINYLLERSSVLILRLDKENRVIFANRYASRLLGDGCIGRLFSDLIVNFNGHFDLEALKREPDIPHLLNFSTVTNLPETLQVTCRNCDEGSIIFGEHDILEFQEFRSTVLDLNNELSNLSRELHKKNNELQTLNELKNQFLGIAAHDLRNPISTIICYTNMYLNSPEELTPDMVEILVDINSLSQFMLHLIMQLLDITVIEMGKMVLDEHIIEVVPFLHEVVKLNGLMAGKKGIALEQHYSGDLDQIKCDRQKIKQVMNNLITNAIKFSASGTTVSVTAKTLDSKLRVEVCDQGPGIPLEEQAQLFKPFGRSSVTSTAGEKCTGLGLAICRRIIEGHGGTIGLKSAPGSGSTFWFTLPLIC